VIRASAVVLAVWAIVGAWSLAGATPDGRSVVVPDFPVAKKDFFLRECSVLKEPKRHRCYVRGLLAIVEKSGDPANELPRIDHTVHANGGWLESNCHILMHEVGRLWAQRHGVTLETLYTYVPKSNDPGCSGGFGMGMVIHLGTKLVISPRSVIPICAKLPTRFRQYTCVHGSGHAFMRGYHGALSSAVAACTSLGANYSPDCAQGAFHDYWISLSGGDGTKRPEGADTDPVSVCGKYAYPRPCWYRYFWERRQSARVWDESDIARLCRRVDGMQRGGCIAGASLLLARLRDPSDHARVCGLLSGSDSLDCLRGVNVPVVARDRFEQLRLIGSCASFPKSTRGGCYSWFGRTLDVVTNGAFRRSGCPRLRTPDARASCTAGARRIREPLGTFS